jgi:hypothetical protein
VCVVGCRVGSGWASWAPEGIASQEAHVWAADMVISDAHQQESCRSHFPPTQLDGLMDGLVLIDTTQPFKRRRQHRLRLPVSTEPRAGLASHDAGQQRRLRDIRILPGSLRSPCPALSVHSLRGEPLQEVAIRPHPIPMHILTTLHEVQKARHSAGALGCPVVLGPLLARVHGGQHVNQVLPNLPNASKTPRCGTRPASSPNAAAWAHVAHVVHVPLAAEQHCREDRVPPWRPLAESAAHRALGKQLRVSVQTRQSVYLSRWARGGHCRSPLGGGGSAWMQVAAVHVPVSDFQTASISTSRVTARLALELELVHAQGSRRGKAVADQDARLAHGHPAPWRRPLVNGRESRKGFTWLLHPAQARAQRGHVLVRV